MINAEQARNLVIDFDRKVELAVLLSVVNGKNWATMPDLNEKQKTELESLGFTVVYTDFSNEWVEDQWLYKISWE